MNTTTYVHAHGGDIEIEVRPPFGGVPWGIDLDDAACRPSFHSVRLLFHDRADLIRLRDAITAALDADPEAVES